MSWHSQNPDVVVDMPLSDILTLVNEGYVDHLESDWCVVSKTPFGSLHAEGQWNKDVCCTYLKKYRKACGQSVDWEKGNWTVKYVLHKGKRVTPKYDDDDNVDPDSIIYKGE